MAPCTNKSPAIILYIYITSLDSNEYKVETTEHKSRTQNHPSLLNGRAADNCHIGLQFFSLFAISPPKM